MAAIDGMAIDVEDRKPLLRKHSKNERYVPPEGDWDPNLPYGGKVFMARKRKPDPWWVKLCEAGLICFTLWLIYYSYYYFDNLHFHITHAYAHLGVSEAQHQTGQRYLRGLGVEKHEEKAISWFKSAAEKGHAKASYDLAVSHVKGFKTGLPKGDAKRLFHHAASNGVEEARDALNEVCARGGCDD